MKLFRDDLSDEEKETFRTWARNNYEVFSPIKRSLASYHAGRMRENEC